MKSPFLLAVALFLGVYRTVPDCSCDALPSPNIEDEVPSDIGASTGRSSRQAQVDRDALYRAVACAILPAVLNSAHGRARRRAIRAAILDTLEAFAVITRTRGGRT